MNKSIQELDNSLNSTLYYPVPMNYGSVLDGDSGTSIPHSDSKRPSSTYSGDTAVDEETYLLHHPTKQESTPLPWGQVSFVLLLQICEPITSLSICPYINQLIGGLMVIDSGSDNDYQVGYYAGLIISLFFATEAVSVLYWNRLSDNVGRKPILLIGLFGTAMSMICFGLSRTFWGLIMSRCLCGLLNGNVGVMKTVMSELTDESNRAHGFSLMTVIWAIGATLGPMIGGTLAQPAERFPNVFMGTFWKEYPYFLPSFATATIVIVTSGITLVFLKETLPKSVLCSSPSEITLDQINDQPLPFRQLLVYPVIISIGNYGVLAFLNIVVDALLPLFLAMPLSVGGLGFDPHTIGYIIGAYGIFTGVFQAFFFPIFLRVAGIRRVFITGMAAFVPTFALFPIMSLDAKKHGVNAFTWICIISILGLMSLMILSYSCIFVYITASAPNKRSLGATNGLSQTIVSMVRAIGPTMATSFFAFSVQHKILGGYGVYAVFFVFSCFATYLALCLPHQMWEAEGND